VIRQDLWGNPVVREGKYFVFHDESEPNTRWLLIGLLFVNACYLNEVRDALLRCREVENYKGEIHFSQLPKCFEGQYGAKARVAKRWIEEFESFLRTKLFCSILAVDNKSKAYDQRVFAQDYHAYNRFTAMALKAGIAWHLGPLNLDRVLIIFVSDAKNRKSRPEEGWVDNFESYIPYRAELDSFLAQASGGNFPKVLVKRVELKDSATEDLLQFIDLFLGAAQMALVAGASRPVKRHLGEIILRWTQDLQKSPGKQEYGMYRKFNLWAFPDAQGRPYTNIPFALRGTNGQIHLF